MQPPRVNTLTAQDIFELYCEQGGCCAISGGLLTIKNGVMRFSVDRIDNNLGHTKANCRLVSRMFNSTAAAKCNFSPAMFQEMRAATKAYKASLQISLESSVPEAKTPRLASPELEELSS
jgi:hypothetical protein